MFRSKRWGVMAAAVVALGCAVSVPSLVAQDRPGGGERARAGAINAKDISLDQARDVVNAALAKAKETNTKMDIAVVDAGGNLKAFNRMDGAWLGSIDISIRKAKTARYFDMPTGEIGKLSQPGGPLYQIEVSNGACLRHQAARPFSHQLIQHFQHCPAVSNHIQI